MTYLPICEAVGGYRH